MIASLILSITASTNRGNKHTNTHTAKGERNQLCISANRTIGSDEKPLRQKEKMWSKGGWEWERSASGHIEGA